MRFRFPQLLCLLVVLVHPAFCQDWPTYMHDNARSGAAQASLELPLRSQWTFEPQQPPAPAWPGPARQDYYHRHYDLRATVAYDRAFHVVGAGESIYFASSAEDKVYALDAATGQVRWTFFTEGPVRFAPVLWGGNLYVGSDDGCVYCLSATDGSLQWKRRIAPEHRLIPGNGRMISLWPIRTGIVVDDGVLYCTAGLFPVQGTYLAALEARTGAVQFRRKIDISPQGYMLASARRLYVPTGRTNPVIYTRDTGQQEGQLSSAGGAYALLTDDILVTGPGRGAKELHADDPQAKDTIATFGGLRMLVSGSVAYMQSERQLAAFDRGRYFQLSRERRDLQRRRGAAQQSLKKIKAGTPEAKRVQSQIADFDAGIARLDGQLKDCYLWTVECAYPHAMIVAGKTLLVGGQDRIAAVDSGSGAVVWTADVKGKACGLAVVNGSLLVSTDAGRIHCFGHSGTDAPTTIAETPSPGCPYPQDALTKRYEDAADYIVGRLPCEVGYCLVLDSGEGRLAYELARRTQLKVIGVELDAEKAEKARRLLDKAGLSGRVAIHHCTSSDLPFTSFFANVVVSDAMLGAGKRPDRLDEISRLVRPYGGVLLLAEPAKSGSESDMQQWAQNVLPGWHVESRSGLTWGVYRRGRPENAGEWTHTYAEPGNSACSGDKIVKGPLTLQWFGEPGPRDMIDRHHRNVPPLFKDGRLFVPGDCVVFAVDAYNGTILWKREVPDSRRLGVFLDGSNMIVDERCLYVAVGDQCRAYDVTTGRPAKVFRMVQPAGGEPRKWGYLACQNSILFGSGCRPDASYTETSYDADLALWYRDMKVVTSDCLFARDKEGGAPLWSYRDGLILNTTLALGDGRIYFVETHSPAALAEKTGRLPIKTLFQGDRQYLVALQQKTGRVVFKQKIDVTHFEEPVYLNFGQGVLLLSGSRLAGKSIEYYYDAFDAETGADLWHAGHDSGLAIDGGHGEYNRHPTIVGDVVYAWPYAYALSSGERIEDWKFNRRGHGCGGVSASAQCLFWRGGNPWMYDLGPHGGPARINAVSRPGCWINMIPAGGLVLIPEASSGCTCGFPVQTSLAYIPQSSLK